MQCTAASTLFIAVCSAPEATELRVPARPAAGSGSAAAPGDTADLGDLRIGRRGGRRWCAGQPILIATKLHPPAVRDQTVPRKRLLEQLGGGSGLRLTLVVCPAGFGKTTLLPRGARPRRRASRSPG